jgi:hypothetical protein
MLCNQFGWLNTHLIVGGEDGKARAGWLVLIRRAQSPEGNQATAKLGEPTLQLLRISLILLPPRPMMHPTMSEGMLMFWYA